jgi:TorA maturation chaperone TorD
MEARSLLAVTLSRETSLNKVGSAGHCSAAPSNSKESGRMAYATVKAACETQAFENRRKMPDVDAVSSISDLSQMLSALLLLPTEDVAKGVIDGSIASDVRDMLREINAQDELLEACVAALSCSADESPSLNDLSALRQEYTRLFSHPVSPSIPIFESIYAYAKESNELNRPAYFVNPVAMDVERRCREIGIKMADGYNLPADHMSVEMGLLSRLYLQLAEAQQGNDELACVNLEEQIASFVESHLAEWAMPFFEDPVDKSRNCFYKGVGLLGVAVMSEIFRKLSVVIWRQE